MTNFFATVSVSIWKGPLAGMLRPFSTSPILNQDRKETVYVVAGSTVSVADIRDMKAESRTVAHWRIIVDWDLQAQRPYVIVDPYDPRGLLYLSRGEYLLQSRVSLANDLTLMVVARPGDLPPVPSSQNSPLLKKGHQGSTSFFQNRSNRLSWKEFVRLRRFATLNVKVRDGMVIVSPDSIERAVIVWARQLFHYSGVTAPERRLPGLYALARTMRTVLRNNGALILTKRLKIALFSVYSYLSGNPLKTTEALGLRIRLTNGLPVMIPTAHRKLIREGNLMWIRIWVSILNIYRSFNVKAPDPETAYKTIRKPLPAFMPNFDKFAYFARYVFPHLVRERGANLGRPVHRFSYSSSLGSIIRSAGANLKGSTSLFSIILDAKAWFLRSKETNHVLNWFELHGDAAAAALMTAISREDHFPRDPELFDQQSSLLPAPPFKTKEEEAKWRKERFNPLVSRLKEEGSLSAFILDAWKAANELKNTSRPILGRLFNFLAPGAKLRTVAICDYWTQLAMKPVHEYIFNILKALGANDATFDQQGTVDEYWARKLSPHWSFDLSAATDSIPITLYIHVLAPFFSEGDEDYDNGYAKALLWSKIMTDRDFGIPSPKKKEIGHTGDRQFRTIRYGTGQPMGAYSSWASMALVHHALVQYSHWLKDTESATNATWFDPYLVLGDDVDLAKDKTVALNYQLTCTDFQVKIGIAKSLSSDSNFFEFANQRLCEEGNISPLSFSEELASQTWNSRVEFASRISRRFGLKMSSSVLLRLVTTARQWQGLIPEFSGLRDAIFTRFLKFILLGPLNTYWHSTIELSIDSVVQWLQLLHEGLLEPVLKSSEDRERISQLFCKRVLDKSQAVLDKVTSRIAPSSPYRVLGLPPFSPGGCASPGMPPPPLSLAFSGFPGFKINAEVLGIHPSFGSTYLQDETHIQFLEAIKRLDLTSEQVHHIRTWFNDYVTDSICVPKLAPISYLYIFSCANRHNEDVRRQVSELTAELRNLEKEYKSRDVPSQLFKLLVGSKPSPLPAIITLYGKISALPKEIRLDLEGVCSSALGIVNPTRPQDLACELVNEVIPLLAQWTGLAVTNLPVLPAGGQRFTPKSLRQFVAFHKKVVEEAGKIKMSVFR
jgi:hypothetical protein